MGKKLHVSLALLLVIFAFGPVGAESYSIMHGGIGVTENGKTKTCPKCGASNPASNHFCNSCNAGIWKVKPNEGDGGGDNKKLRTKKCPKCGHRNKAGNHLCDNCNYGIWGVTPTY